MLDPLPDANGYDALDRFALLDGVNSKYEFSDGDLWDICNTIFGDKPILSLRYHFKSPTVSFDALPTRAFFDDLGLDHRTKVKLARDEGFVAHHEAALEGEDSLRYGDWHSETDIHARNYGRKFGYPEDAIEAYIEHYDASDDALGTIVQEYMDNLLAEGAITPEEYAYADIVNWIPPKTLDGVRRAATTGERRVERNLAFAREHGLTTLERRLYGYWMCHKLNAIIKYRDIADSDD